CRRRSRYRWVLLHNDVGRALVVDRDRPLVIEERNRIGGPLAGQITLAAVDEAVHPLADRAGFVFAGRVRVPPQDAGVVEAGDVGIVPGAQAVRPVSHQRVDLAVEVLAGISREDPRSEVLRGEMRTGELETGVEERDVAPLQGVAVLRDGWLGEVPL